MMLQKYYEIGKRWTSHNEDGSLWGELHDIMLSYKRASMDADPNGDPSPSYSVHVRGLYVGEVYYDWDEGTWDTFYGERRNDDDVKGGIDALAQAIRRRFHVYPDD